MLILSIDEVRPGTKLAMGVMHPEQRNQELLRAGFILDEAVIEKLRSLNIRQVFVDFPGLDDLDKYMEPFLGPERQQIYQGVKAAIGSAERERRPIAPYSTYYTATRDFIKLLVTRPENRAMLDLLGADTGDGGAEVAHATAVAHLALVIGLRMEPFLIRERPRLTADKARDVTNLGVAGMLHDIGKTKLSPAARKANLLAVPSSEEDKLEWESHPQAGYDLIHNQVETTTAAAVLHHHQRYDGSGFPRRSRDDISMGFSGSSIHPFARILAAADLFERLSTTDDGRRRTNYEVLRIITTDYAAWLDPEVLATLPQVLPPFSPGRRVALSDGTSAIVTGFNPRDPYRPPVKRIRLDDFQLTDQVVELDDGSGLHVAEIEGLAVPRPRVAA